MNHQSGISLRKIAEKLNVHRRIVHHELKDMSVYYRKKQHAPRNTEQQIEQVSKCPRRLYRALLEDDYELIMDDKKYFTLTNQSISANRGFYTSDPSVTSSEVKFKHTQKYSANVLVRKAVSEKGISKPFFAKQTQEMNEITYLKQCIKDSLIDFTNKHHNIEQALFWSRFAVEPLCCDCNEFFFDKQNINFVSREKNP